MSFELGAELLSYGALVAFMMVDVAAARRAFLERGLAWVFDATASMLGCAVCAVLWLNLSALALEAGTIWAASGFVLWLVRKRSGSSERFAERRA